jgi:hypothetical protein
MFRGENGKKLEEQAGPREGIFKEKVCKDVLYYRRKDLL